jgi:hypothetical protein
MDFVWSGLDRHPAEHGGAATGSRLDFKPGSEGKGAITHRSQAHASFGITVAGCNAGAIILD